MGGQRDGRRGPADMLLAVHAEMLGNACVLCVFWFCPAGFYCQNPHDVSCENSTALVCWCMRADFVRPADRMIKAQTLRMRVSGLVFVCLGLLKQAQL